MRMRNRAVGARAREGLSFLLVGAAGYLVDVGAFNLLWGRAPFAAWDPAVAKIVAVGLAMVVTFAGSALLTNVVGLALGTAFRHWTYRRFVFAPAEAEREPLRWAALRWEPLVPLATGAAALGLGAWNLGRPALWLDETASAVSSLRTWPDLWLMLHGTDAPLVPYYAVLKCARTAATWVLPSLPAHHLEVLVRWPSVAATALAVGLLAHWLQRVASTATAVVAATLLMLTAGFSRYGQEARPYAIVLCLAITATVLWWRAVVEGRRQLVPLYVLAVGALVFLHVMAALLVPVHLVAAVVLRPEPVARGRRVVTTLVAGALGLALAAPWTIMAVRYGQGAGRYAKLGPGDLLAAFVSLLGQGADRYLFVGTVVGLAVVGLSRWNSERSGPLVRLALVWAVVPPVVFVGAVSLRPNLLIPRYLLFTLPAWAILAATGLVVLVHEARQRGPVWSRVPATALAASLIVGLGLVQGPVLAGLRAPGGHGEDIVPSLVAADSPAYRRLPIYVGPAIDGVQVQAYAPWDSRRLVNTTPQADLAPVWPVHVPGRLLHGTLGRWSRMIVIIRRGKGLPPSALRQGYRIAGQLPHGRAWVTFLAVRGPLRP